jgi:hypothetical protein
VATASKAGRRQPCLTQGSSASFIAIEGAMHRHKRASSARRGPGGTTPEARRAWSRQHGRRAARQGPVPRTACVAWAEKRLGGPKSWGACVGPRLDVRARGGLDAEAWQAPAWRRAERVRATCTGTPERLGAVGLESLCSTPV